MRLLKHDVRTIYHLFPASSYAMCGAYLGP